MTKIKAFWDRMYFGKDHPLNYRIYMIFFFECLAISIPSAITNTLLGKGLFGIIFQWSYILFCTVVLFVPLRWRMAISKPLLVFVTFVYVPFLFFQTAGYDGTAGLFSLLGFLLLTIMFRAKARVVLVVSNIAVWICICVLQYLHPELVVPHGGEQAKFMDYIVALVLSASGIAILGVYIRNAFEGEQTRISSLLRSEEKTNQQLAELSNRDPLTGAYNRRFLSQFLTQRLNAAAQEDTRLNIMQLDIDHFKAINDTWGHGFGDEVLVRCTAAMQEQLRKDDVLARMGGEEFALVLTNMGPAEAKEVANRTRRAVSEIVFENGAHITVSIGLVQARQGERLDSVLDRADKCLYEAKNAGRDRVVSG